MLPENTNKHYFSTQKDDFLNEKQIVKDNEKNKPEKTKKTTLEIKNFEELKDFGPEWAPDLIKGLIRFKSEGVVITQRDYSHFNSLENTAALIRKVDNIFKITFFKVHKKLGVGAIGIAYKLEDPLTQQAYAVKVPFEKYTYKRNRDNDLSKEIEMHVILRGGNWEDYVKSSKYRKEIKKIKPIGIQEMPYGIHHRGNHGFLMMLYDGDLHDLTRIKEARSLEVLDNLITECLQGLAYIHSKNLSHNDIQRSNIFYKKTNDSYHFYISDFDRMNVLVKDGKSLSFNDKDIAMLAEAFCEFLIGQNLHILWKKEFFHPLGHFLIKMNTDCKEKTVRNPEEYLKDWNELKLKIY